MDTIDILLCAIDDMHVLTYKTPACTKEAPPVPSKTSGKSPAGKEEPLPPNESREPDEKRLN
jgi:hypothetical protein